MKYYLLKTWEEENSGTAFSLEAVLCHPELVILRFKSHDPLFLVLSPRNAYPFYSASLPIPMGIKKIWPILDNTKCQKVQLADKDRILYISMLYIDIYQQQRNYMLIAELMSPKPNLILAENIDNKFKIIDALHKYGYADNPMRQVLPGLPYSPPKTSFSVDIQPPKPEYPEGIATCNEYFVWHYQNVLEVQQQQNTQLQQRQLLIRQLDKLKRKHDKQLAELDDAKQAEYYLACAEALKVNLGKIAPGMTTLKAVNYLDPALLEIEIPLLPGKSAKENLNHYIRKYHKAKSGWQRISQNLQQTDSEISETSALLERSIQGELLDLHLDKQDAGNMIKSRDSLLSRLLTLKINDSWQIVIGRKAKENDFITTELAKPHDWWFHSRIYHGAHVLLRCMKKLDPDDTLIGYCASLAAWYSKAKFSTNVPVDYTQIRYVRKPRKSPPGFVTYTQHQSVYATPLDLRTVRERLSLGQKET